jgi:allantoinase
VRPADVVVHDGRILRVEENVVPDCAPAVTTLDVGHQVILPGLVDTHVHVNEPGRTQWEGFETATRAAAAGGVTTIVDMPLNSVPATTSVEGLHAKRRAAEGRCYVDVGFWGGVVPGNVDQIEPLARVGAMGFKCFLSPSGVDEFPNVTADDLRLALPVLARLNLPLLVHAELPALLRDPLAIADHGPADPRRYQTWLHSRPPDSECAAIALLIDLAQRYGAQVHIVHVATSAALPALAAARGTGAHVTAETCPHYLTFAAEDIPDGATAFKCAPPIRERVEREGLWKGLASGDLDFVASDHSPCPPDLKQLESGDFIRAWGGIASLQLGLAALWTGMADRGLDINRLAEWLSARPAALAGLAPVKGRIAEGADADLVVWDPESEALVDARALYHRHPLTPYDGARLRGEVRMTLLRGEIVFEPGRQFGPAGGRLLTRSATARST